jgi:hypothetical protein
MNGFTVHPAREVGRFLLATLAAAASSFIVGAALSPFNPMKGSVDATFWRLFVGSSIIVGNAMVYFIRGSRYSGWKLLGLSLLAYVGAAQLLELPEMIAFNFLFEFSAAQIAYVVVSQLITALLFVPLAITVAGKWRAPAQPVEDRTGPFPVLNWRPILVRVAILGVLWYVCYMVAGWFIADPITHGYYAAKMKDLSSINAWLLIVQFFRGIAWTGLIVLGVRILNRPLRESGLLVGLLYGVFHSAGLLLPSAFMPAEMRLSHLPEIVLSLVMFAGLAVSVLGFGRERARASVGPAPVTSR